MQHSTSPNDIGTAFEGVVADLLGLLKAEHPALVEIRHQPRLRLYNGDIVIPDFELSYAMPHQRDLRLLECQSRQKTSQDIARKIRDIKGLSSKNRFMFLYRSHLPTSVRESLEADGVVYFSLFEFADFMRRLNDTLSAVAALPSSAALLKRAQSHLEERPNASTLAVEIWPKKPSSPSEFLNKIAGVLLRDSIANPPLPDESASKRLDVQIPSESYVLKRLETISLEKPIKDEGMVATPRTEFSFKIPRY